MSLHQQPVRPGAATYALGQADLEVQRLLLQGRLYDDHTEHARRLAGLRPGMRVLDVLAGLVVSVVAVPAEQNPANGDGRGICAGQ